MSWPSSPAIPRTEPATVPLGGPEDHTVPSVLCQVRGWVGQTQEAPLGGRCPCLELLVAEP